MIVCCHQPNYLPYEGILEKIAMSDLFLVHDDAQFSKSDFHHRQRIQYPNKNGFKWLTIPVHKKCKPLHSIIVKNERINGKYWQTEHFKALEESYRKTKGWSLNERWLSVLYANPPRRLTDFTMRFYWHLVSPAKIVFMSQLGLSHLKGSEKLAIAVKELNGDVYLSGSGAHSQSSWNEAHFKEQGIAVNYHKYQGDHYYAFLHSCFTRGLSLEDYIADISNRCAS